MLGSKLARKNQARKLLDSNFTKSKLRKLYFLYICQDFSIMHAKYHQKLCFLTHESLLTNKKWTKNFAGSSIARARSKNLLLEFGSARKVLENFWLETRLGSKNFGSKCSSHENFGSDPSLLQSTSRLKKLQKNWLLTNSIFPVQCSNAIFESRVLDLLSIKFIRHAFMFVCDCEEDRQIFESI